MKSNRAAETEIDLTTLGKCFTVRVQTSDMIFLKIYYLVMNINTYDISTITTILKYFVQWPKRMGHETDTVYVKSSPIFCSKNAMGYVG